MLPVKDLARAGALRAIRAAEAEPVLISKNNEPAVWMIGATALARAAGAVNGDPETYSG